MASFFKILEGGDRGFVINIDQIGFINPQESWLRIGDESFDLSKNEMNRLLRQIEITPTPFND